MNIKKKKILVTSSSFPRFENDIKGGGLFVFELCNKISNNIEVSVLAPLIKDSSKFSKIKNINIIRYPYYFFWRNNLINENSGIAGALSKNKLYFIYVPVFLIKQLFAIKKNIKKNKIEIIHAHWLIPQGIVACFYKKYFNKKIKVVCTSHGSDLNMSFGFIGKMLLKFILKNTDALTVVSQELKEKAIALGYKKNIEVIPMGINVNKFKHIETNEIKEKYKLSANVLLFVGKYIEVKGIEYLIRALPKVLQTKPNTTLMLVGDGMLKEDLKKIASDLNISDKIIFTGFIANDELPKYFLSADIVVIPSLSEGCPVVMEEAMACSSIVVTSDIEAFQSHIKNDINGYMVPVKNSDALAEKIIEVLENKNELNSIRENARKYALENFDWEIVKDRYLKLLSEI